MLKRLLTLAVLGSMIGPVLPSGAAVTYPRHDSKPYVGFQDAVASSATVTCDQNEELGVGLGMVCFDVLATDGSVDIAIEDLVNSQPGFYYAVVDEEGECASEGPPGPTGETCSSQGFGCPDASVSLPVGSRGLYVFLLGPVGAAVCAAVGTPGALGAAAAGDVVVEFRRR